MKVLYSRTGLFVVLGSVCILLFFVFSPAEAADCSLSPIPLEVKLGTNISQSTGLTNYIAQLYTFIVGAIGVLATVMIMFHGFGWVIAAGNAEAITKAKAGIVSALIGLVLAFGGYTLLNIINPATVNLVDICPAEIGFQSAEDANRIQWEKCPGGLDTECTGFDYCGTAGACKCETVDKVCRPTGVQTLGSGLRCKDANNCTPPLQCLGGNNIYPGTCVVGTEGTVCTLGGNECLPGMTCVMTAEGNSTVASVGQCLAATGRSNLESCDNDEQCASKICHSYSKHCDSGIGDSESYQDCGNEGSQLNCQPGYICKGTALSRTCTPKVENDACDEANRAGISGTNALCNPTSTSSLFCVENNGDGVGEADKECFDGSIGDPCDSSSECAPGGVCKTICEEGLVRDAIRICSEGVPGNNPCLVNDDCDIPPFSAPFCVGQAYWYNYNNERTAMCPGTSGQNPIWIGTCQNGTEGSKCDEDSDCLDLDFNPNTSNCRPSDRECHAII